MVTEIKRDKEASVEYMKVYEHERMIREEGIGQGIEQGREQKLRECIEKWSKTA